MTVYVIAYNIVISTDRGNTSRITVVVSQFDHGLSLDIQHIWLGDIHSDLSGIPHGPNVVGMIIDEQNLCYESIILSILRIVYKDDEISLGIQKESMSNNMDRSNSYMDMSYSDLSITFSS
jgi:hypothetical protein